MKTVELELEELYFQKQKLEEKIKELENSLKNEKLKDKKEFSKDEKIELFKELFISRADIYSKKWKSKDGSKEGFLLLVKHLWVMIFCLLQTKI